MWIQIDNGETIGTVGSECGEIIEDNEHPKGARLTLEKGGDIAPYPITTGVYGCFFHTTHLSTLEIGLAEMKAMKEEINEFFERETTRNEDHEWIENFVAKH